MEKKWTVFVTGFFVGIFISAVLLTNISDLSFQSNFLQYVLIIASIGGVIGIKISPKIQDNKRIRLSKWVLAVSIPLLLVLIFFKIFFRDILDMNYLSIIGLACTSIAMFMLIRAERRSLHA